MRMGALASGVGRRLPVLTVAILALAVVPAAEATFEGERGPIAFSHFAAADEGDRSSVFSVESPGQPALRLAGLANLSWFSDYSPDGRRIIFTRTPVNGPDVLYTMKSDGTDRARLSTGCSGECLGDSSAAWDPTGSRIVFERAFGPIAHDTAARVELHVANRDGGNETTIPLALDRQEPHDAQWAPDGDRLAVNILNVRNRKPKFGSAIYVLRPDGTGLEQITPPKLNAGSPDWSPSGNRIVFNSHYEGQATSEIYTVRPDGSDLHRVRHQREGRNAFEPVYSPDGKRIAFVQTDPDNPPHIWTMRSDGTRRHQLTYGDAADLQPDWGALPR